MCSLMIVRKDINFKHGKLCTAVEWGAEKLGHLPDEISLYYR